ncbi:MAG TPA: glycosyltransferase family 4 protein [Actinomycetota bacterium]
MEPLRIAVIGSRGVPATFGGIEHHVEELGARMVARGHEVVVFARTNYQERPVREHRGMRVVPLPTVSSKHLDAIVHSSLASARSLTGRFDVVQYHAIGPGIPAALPRAFSRAKVALTVHGRDGERAKWGRGAKAVLSAAEWLSARVPDATIVVSEDLARHYREAYRRRTDVIVNGVEAGTPLPAAEIASRWGLGAGAYLLFVGRLVPEKAPDMLLRAFRTLDAPDLRLVIAGGSSFTDEYVASLERAAAADPRVVMAGYVYGDTLRELYANAAAFVLPSFLEGLPLTLLEAASFGTPVVVSDIPPHLEIAHGEGPGHRVFATGDERRLRDALDRALADPSSEREAAAGFRDDVLARFDWDEATDRTLAVYERITRGRRVGGR